jgi:hypothetical protein
MLTGFKMAEMMVSLAGVGLLPVSRICVYQRPPLDDLREAQKKSMPIRAADPCSMNPED